MYLLLMIQSFILYYLRLMDVLHNLSMGPFSKLSVSMLPLSTILIFDFGMFPTVWYLFVFHFILTVPFHFILTVPFLFISTVPFHFILTVPFHFISTVPFHFVSTVPFHFISTVPFHFISTVPLSLQGAHLYIFVSYIHNIDFFAALFVVIYIFSVVF